MATTDANTITYWYLWRNGEASGPFTTRELVRDLAVGRVLWTDAVWGDALGAPKWGRICDLEEFRASMPELPEDHLIVKEQLAEKLAQARELAEQTDPRPEVADPKPMQNLPKVFKDSLAPLAAQAQAALNSSQVVAQKGKAAVSAVMQKLTRGKNAEEDDETTETHGVETPSQRKGRVWFMEFEGKEYGPLTLQELTVILKSGKLKGDIHVSHDGMQNWKKITDVSELELQSETSEFKSKTRGTTKTGEHRKAPRVPLIAEVRFSSGDGRGDPNIYTGICRDISMRGLLILTKRCPTLPGVKVKLEVVPLDSQGLAPFSAFGEVVRILPGKNGFSIRFEMVPGGASQALEEYIKAQLSVLSPP